MTRRERRNINPDVLAKREALASGSVLGLPTVSANNKGGGGGWGVGVPNAKPATGQTPAVNPFIIPKAAGLNVFSQTFPSNYFVEWDLTAWREACDKVMKMGYTQNYATMVSWVYECSPFIISLFEALGSALERIPVFIQDKNGNKLDIWTEELCGATWTIQLRKEILYSYFWGFSGINFDPIEKKVYKYPMQDVDPINRLLKQSTYSFNDGVNFADHDNLLFIQPSTSNESFLGWMQSIARSFIQINMNKNSWIAAGKRLAYPVLTVGYPQNDSATDPTTGLQYSPYKKQAEEIATNIDPTQAMTYPYTKDSEGNIQKAINIEFEKTGSSAGMHALFKDFNTEEKNEIREMVLGGTLTGDAGKAGSRALGEVQERKFESVVEAKMGYVLSILNGDFLSKIRKFYTNIPDGCKFVYENTKVLSFDDIKLLSGVVKENGKRLTDEFFVANGIMKEFIEDAPIQATINPEPDIEVNMAVPSRSFLGALKKKY